MKKCSQCNQNFSDDVVFCPKCGRKLEPLIEEKHFCSKCGQPMDIKAKFCAKCGAPNEALNQQDFLNTVINTADKIKRQCQDDIKKDDTIQMLKEQYLSFSGRLNRKPYIIRSLIVYVIMLVLLTIVDVIFEDEISFDEFGMLTTSPGTVELLFTFIIAVIGIVLLFSLTIRRLHDLDKTGWLALLNYVPIANIALSIYVLFFRGTEGNNKYGEDPLQGK